MADDWDDDDEWDDDAIEAKLEAQLKEKEKERRREEGLDSESEEEKPQEAATAPKPKPKKVYKKDEPKVEEPKLSAEEEKLRRQKLVEEADARLAQDLFSGIEKPEETKKKEEEAKAAKAEEERKKKEAAKPKIIYNDAFEKVELKVQADIEKLVDGCVKKVENSPAKGGAVRFLSDLLKNTEGQLEAKDVTELLTLMTAIVKQKKASAGAVDAKNNKANNKMSKTTKFNAASEWEEVYGGGDGDEEWTQEEWDEWTKQQEAEWAGK